MNKKLALLLSTAVILGISTSAIAGEDTAPIINLDSLNLTETPLNGATNSTEDLPSLDGNLNIEIGEEEDAKEVISQETIPKNEELEPPVHVTAIEYNPNFYANPNLTHAKTSYETGNFTGAAQELFAYIKKNPEDPEAFYYLAMTLAGLGDSDAAVQAYEKTVALTNDEGFRQLAAKGRDCLRGGPLCQAQAEIIQTADPDPLDKFITDPYGDGLSPELKEQMKLKRLENIQKNINRKPELEPDEVQEIKDFDAKYSGYQEDEEAEEDAETTGFAASILGDQSSKSEVSNDEIVSALETLRKAGMTVTIQPSTQPAGFQNQQFNEMSMMLGGGQNSYNDPMAQMVPYMMQASTPEGAQNINPQVVQAMMMNSMMGSLDFNTSDND
ncbi:tetratricopeptide repeat protein [bacterium]|nr:tetratricopeptide repeat protein [bacterium]